MHKAQLPSLHSKHIFHALLISHDYFRTGVSSYSTVLSFFERERNMFYRHKAALMYDYKSITLAIILAELPFILLQGMIFSVCFYFPLGKSICWVSSLFLGHTGVIRTYEVLHFFNFLCILLLRRVCCRSFEILSVLLFRNCEFNAVDIYWAGKSMVH